MPKRIPTPPPPEDEPRYLTVVHPYPLNANLLLHADRRTLALWLACCTGKDVLLAMFYKPTVSAFLFFHMSSFGPLCVSSLSSGRRGIGVEGSRLPDMGVFVRLKDGDC